MGVEFSMVHPALISAIQTLTPATEPFLQELESYAKAHRFPILQPESAQLLEVLTGLKQPTRVLEIGTAIGYSAIRMAKAMSEGHILTIEKDPETKKLADGFLKRYPTRVTFEVLEGDAAVVLKTVKGPFDLVFIDAAKSHYKRYLDLVTPMLSPGALVISDNVLFRGLITGEVPDKRFKTITRNLKEYLAYLMVHDQFTTSLVPIGDGFAVSLFKGSTSEHKV